MSGGVQAARSGTPTVLVFEGSAGTGKTTLLADVMVEAKGFQVVFIDGAEGNSAPYSALERAGLITERPPNGTAVLAAVRSLRARLDELATTPLLLSIDDLQWVDPESVEALAWLLRRLAGDRILAVVGTRMLKEGQHASWQRWIQASSSVQRLTLTGLSEEAALELASERRPSMTREVARLLWEHTGGNPLYLTALLNEYEPADMSRMHVLPAPLQFEQWTARQLASLDHDSVNLVRCVAVLGTGWTSLPVLVAVSRVRDVDRAAQQAQDAGLLQVRNLHSGLAARPSHGLVRAAVYNGTPLPQRHSLHLRAAAAVSDPTAALEHRVQAAEAWDDQLAGELEARAVHLHDGRSHRLASQLLEWSSEATSEPGERLRRRLDSYYEALLAGEHGAVREALSSLSDGLSVRVALLRGVEAVLNGRPDDAVRTLSRVAAREPEPGEEVPYVRVNTFLAWARMLAGGATESVLAGLARADALGVCDPALTFYSFYSRSIVAARASAPEQLAEQVAFLPEAVSEVPPEQRYLLSWRGDMRLFMGVVPEAATDIRAAIKHVEASGGSDLLDGGLRGALGIAHWLHGDWDLAKVAFNLVHDAVEQPMPIVLCYLPLHPIGVGDFAAADQLLEQAIDTFERMPWQEAVQQLLIPRVMRAHASGDGEERAAVLPDMRRRWPQAFVDTGLVSSLWVLHAALAAIWAEDDDYAEQMLARLDRPGLARWCPAALAWLRGLLAERRGEPRSALDHLRDATAAGAPDLPFYYAHMLSDHGRVASLNGERDEATSAVERAERLYRRLGAAPYLPADRYTQHADEVSGSIHRDFRLTEREQDIAALIARGMSYVQIARELFITRSTVNYHLGHIYAKAGVRSRHELSDVLRCAPGG